MNIGVEHAIRRISGAFTVEEVDAHRIRITESRELARAQGGTYFMMGIIASVMTVATGFAFFSVITGPPGIPSRVFSIVIFGFLFVFCLLMSIGGIGSFFTERFGKVIWNASPNALEKEIVLGAWRSRTVYNDRVIKIVPISDRRTGYSSHRLVVKALNSSLIGTVHQSTNLDRLRDYALVLSEYTGWAIEG